MKDKLATALLAFFLGSFGVHRFYLGQTGRGILYLIFCWTPIVWLLGFIDFIVFLTMDDRKFDRLYNYKDDYEDYGYKNSYQQDTVEERMSLQSIKHRRSSADEIEKLHNLMVRGIISEKEFAERKERL